MLVSRLIVSMLIPALAITTLADGARLEGSVRDVEGRSASGYRVHLIAEDGRGVARSTVDEAGRYAFAELGAGAYSLGLESRSGEMAAVATPPIELGEDELARRDIGLMKSDAESVNGVLAVNPSLGTWWGDLTSVGKIWTIVGIVGAVALTVSALDDDDEEEATAF